MLVRPPSLLADQPQQRGVGGEQHAPFFEELAGPGEQRGRLLQTRRFLEHEAFQGLCLVGVEDGQLQIATNACLVVRNRMLPGRIPVDLDRLNVQLHGDEVQQLVADLQGLLGRKAAEQPDEADLIGEAQAVLVAATLGDLGQVGLGQGRLADHLSPREREWRHVWSHSV